MKMNPYNTTIYLFDHTHLNQNKDEWRSGLRKIADAPPIPCQHPEHKFPGMIVLEPGIYEHICPQCGARQIRRIPRVYL